MTEEDKPIVIWVDWNASSIEAYFNYLASDMNINPNELKLLLRIMLVGNKSGPSVFEIAETIGMEETYNRIINGLTYIEKNIKQNENV
jgi:glutamyl-tRNA synthetase